MSLVHSVTVSKLLGRRASLQLLDAGTVSPIFPPSAIQPWRTSDLEFSFCKRIVVLWDSEHTICVKDRERQ